MRALDELEEEDAREAAGLPRREARAFRVPGWVPLGDAVDVVVEGSIGSHDGPAPGWAGLPLS